MSIDVNMFWHGRQLGVIHSACVRSFLRHGHTVTMHCYERPNDLPEDVRVFDAGKIMPLSDLQQQHGRKCGDEMPDHDYLSIRPDDLSGDIPPPIIICCWVLKVRS